MSFTLGNEIIVFAYFMSLLNNYLCKYTKVLENYVLFLANIIQKIIGNHVVFWERNNIVHVFYVTT